MTARSSVTDNHPPQTGKLVDKNRALGARSLVLRCWLYHFLCCVILDKQPNLSGSVSCRNRLSGSVNPWD